MREIHVSQYLKDVIISNARLQSYTAVFNPANDDELIGAYLWNLHVSSELYRLLGVAEVTLRNAIDGELQPNLGDYWWRKTTLHYLSYPSQPPFEVQAVYDNFDKAAKAVIKEKRNRYNILGKITPRHQEILAKTEFSTWEFLLNSEFNGPRLIWPARMRGVFRSTWPTASSNRMLSHARDLTKTVREYRNRISHHEPAWKKHGVNCEEDAVSHIQAKIKKIIELVEIISTEKSRYLIASGLVGETKRAASIETLRLFQGKAAVESLAYKGRLRRALKKALASNHSVPVSMGTKKKELFIISPL